MLPVNELGVCVHRGMLSPKTDNFYYQLLLKVIYKIIYICMYIFIHMDSYISTCDYCLKKNVDYLGVGRK